MSSLFLLLPIAGFSPQNIFPLSVLILCRFLHCMFGEDALKIFLTIDL